MLSESCVPLPWHSLELTGKACHIVCPGELVSVYSASTVAALGSPLGTFVTHSSTAVYLTPCSSIPAQRTIYTQMGTLFVQQGNLMDRAMELPAVGSINVRACV